MIRFTTMFLASLLILPFTPATAVAKAPSTAPQVHVVKQGDTLYEVAKGHGLTVNELKQLNGLSSNRLKLGQKLALNRAAAPPMPKPAAAKPRPAETARPATGKDIHIVKKGDTLFTIARRHQVNIDELKRLNDLSGSQLKIGQRLALAGTVEAEPVAPIRTKPATSAVHVVKKGDTLQAIARRHGTTINELKRVNGLSGSRLRIGQRLALDDPEYAPTPLLLPGDSSEDEVLAMAYSSNSELERAAFAFLSTPYRFGGSSRKGIDCSAFVQQTFREVDVDLPRSAREQFHIGEKVERDDLQPGDLLFFRTYARFPSHVGIYLGDGKMIHASSRSHRVVVTSIDYPYYRKRFIGAKRISLLDAEESLAVSAQLQIPDEADNNEMAAPAESPSLLAAGEAPAPLMVGGIGNPALTPEATVAAAEPTAAAAESAPVATEPVPHPKTAAAPPAVPGSD